MGQKRTKPKAEKVDGVASPLPDRVCGVQTFLSASLAQFVNGDSADRRI